MAGLSQEVVVIKTMEKIKHFPPKHKNAIRNMLNKLIPKGIKNH